MFWNHPKEGVTGVGTSKTKLRMMFLVLNLALYSCNSLASIHLISTAFQSIANQDAGFRSYCLHCVLEGQGLHEDQRICTNCCTVQLLIINLVGLQHMQVPELSTSIFIVTLFSCQPSTCVISSMCNILSNHLVFLKIEISLYSGSSSQLKNTVQF